MRARRSAPGSSRSASGSWCSPSKDRRAVIGLALLDAVESAVNYRALIAAGSIRHGARPADANHPFG
jgi:hypothetical protein